MTKSTEPNYMAWRLPKRLAYVVGTSLPYADNDDACRTHEVARAMVERGFEVIVFSRPGWPWDSEGFVPTQHVDLDVHIEGVRYILLPSLTERRLEGREKLRFAERAIYEAMSVFRPALIMASSNWENAEPAANVARRLDLPFVYEVRDRLHRGANRETSVSVVKEKVRSEARIAENAITVLALTDAIRDDFLALGLPTKQVNVLANGIRARPPQVPIWRRSQFGCTAKHLIGFFCQADDDEAGDEPARLVARLREDGVDVSALLLLVDQFGAPIQDISSSKQSSILTAAQSLAVAEHVVVAPPTKRAWLGGYYALCDSLITSSRSFAQSALAEPLEPYRAAAYGVPQFIANDPELAAVARDTQASTFVDGDLSDIAEQMRQHLREGAFIKNPREEVFWQTRIDALVAVMSPLAQQLAEQEATRPMSAAPLGRMLPPFDLTNIPETVFTPTRGLPIAGIGPCSKQRSAADSFTALTRSNLYSQLALSNPGVFLVDWEGLRKEADSGLYDEWADLWMVSNMRLNRQIMDACRIAVNRGWRLIVLGPISESSAPMFRTVSSVFEVLTPNEEEAA